MAGTKGRRIVDAIDDVARELRTANLIGALALGTAALDDADLGKFKDPKTVARQARLNQLRAGIRAGLGLEQRP